MDNILITYNIVAFHALLGPSITVPDLEFKFINSNCLKLNNFIDLIIINIKGLAYLRVSVQRFAHLRNTFKRFSVGL